MGFSGVYGLDYNALFAVAGVLKIEMDDRVLGGIMHLEQITLEHWQKEREHPSRSN